MIDPHHLENFNMMSGFRSVTELAVVPHIVPRVVVVQERNENTSTRMQIDKIRTTNLVVQGMGTTNRAVWALETSQ